MRVLELIDKMKGLEEGQDPNYLIEGYKEAILAGLSKTEALESCIE